MDNPKRRKLNDRYILDNGLRKVEPYDYIYRSTTKQRWIGRSIFDVFKKEFVDRNQEYYNEAIKQGKIKVNNENVELETKLKNGDIITHSIHRHEPPVTDKPILILHQTEHLVVIDKPSSIPVHPTGRYHYNTVVEILCHDSGFEKLHPINRLDRLTSGVMLLALNTKTASEFESQLKNRNVVKKYVARVGGKFPSHIVCKEPIKVLSHKVGICHVDAAGKECETEFSLLKYNGIESIVECIPKTGRTHQIRVHLKHLGFPIVNDPVYSENKRELVAYKETDASLCPGCTNPLADPSPESLCLYLHSYSYAGHGWKFETDFPSWATNFE